MKLEPGKEANLRELTIELRQPNKDAKNFFNVFHGTGKFHLNCDPVLGNTSSGVIKLDPALEKLATGKLELVVKEVPGKHDETLTVALEKDGTLFLNGKKMTLDELKAQAAKDGEKKFTIRADKDVPYAKVIEVVEALKAAGGTEFSFSAEQRRRPDSDAGRESR